MAVEFDALIKELRIKSLASLDKEAWLILQFDAKNTKTLNALNELHQADELVRVTVDKNYD